jgi:hypothetical protein
LLILIGKLPQPLGNRAAKTCREKDRRQRIADLRKKTARLRQLADQVAYWYCPVDSQKLKGTACSPSKTAWISWKTVWHASSASRLPPQHDHPALD